MTASDSKDIVEKKLKIMEEFVEKMDALKKAPVSPTPTPTFEIGEYVFGRGQVWIVRNLVSNPSRDRIHVKGALYNLYKDTTLCRYIPASELRLAADEEIRDALALKPGDTVRVWRDSVERESVLSKELEFVMDHCEVKSCHKGYFKLGEKLVIVPLRNVHLVRRTSEAPKPEEVKKPRTLGQLVNDTAYGNGPASNPTISSLVDGFAKRQLDYLSADTEKKIENLFRRIIRQELQAMPPATETKEEPDGLGFTDFERAAVKYTANFTHGSPRAKDIARCHIELPGWINSKLNACDLIFKGKTVEQLAAAIEAYRPDPEKFMRGVKVDTTA